MKNLLLSGAAALAMVVSGAAGAQTASPAVALFAQNAALGNQFEIEEAKIVLQDSTDQAVRVIASTLLRDHEMSQADLDRAAQFSGVATHFVFDSIRRKHIDDLGLMDTPTLDQTFLNDQATAHARAAASLSDYAANGEDPALRAYARETLPHILMHQRMIAGLTGGSVSF